MKLENIDLKELRKENVPEFENCPCELCDDGCFDRAKLKHYSTCRKTSFVKNSTEILKRTKCPPTHYQMTFKPIVGPSGRGEDHRRSICPPPPDNEIPISFKNFPISGISSQREHFQFSRPAEPTKPAKPSSDNLVSNRVAPMQTKTQYQLEFVEKPIVPIKFEQLQNPARETNFQISDPKGNFASQTTSRTHFKSWKSSPSHPFSELPPVAVHVVFPNGKRSFSTSTGETFIQYENPTPAKPVFGLEKNGNLRVAGSMDLQTNYQKDFVPHRLNSARSAPEKRREKQTEGKVFFRRPMNEISQTKSDFRSYPKHRPAAAFDMPTFSSQFQIGSSSKFLTKQSQYRSDYEGIDTLQHPRAPLAGQNEKKRVYVPPLQKMETKTVTHRDFPALDVANLPRNRLVPMATNLSVNDQIGPMESVSMSHKQFQPYEQIRVRRYADPLPEIYVSSSAKFDGRTTNGETYQGQKGERAKLHVSEVKIVPTVSKHDFNTNYRLDFHPHGLTICAAKAHAVLEKRNEKLSLSAH